MRVVREADGPLQPKEISNQTGRPKDSVQKALGELKKNGALVQPGYGLYDLPERVDTIDEQEKPTQNSSLHHIPEVEVDAGPGREPQLEEVNGGFYVPEQYIRQMYGVRPSKLCVMRVLGDSMMDTLRPGQRVVSARWEGENLRDGTIYGLHGPTGFMVKRVRFARKNNEDVIRICSDNSDADEWWVTTDEFEQEYTPLAWAIEVGQKL